MKIQLMGPEDVVRRWAELFDKAGIVGEFYPMRGAAGGLRWYADADDRRAREAPIVAVRKPPRLAKARGA